MEIAAAHRTEPRPKNLVARALVATGDAQLERIAEDAAHLLSCAATFVSSGRDAISRIRSGKFDWLLIDHGLFSVPGLDVVLVLSRNASLAPVKLPGQSPATWMSMPAMNPGVLTVLEKPVAATEIVSAVRQAGGEPRSEAASRGVPRATAFVPHSIGERWASLVLKACQADNDFKTLGAWASLAGLSYSSLCESCRLAGIQPLAARDLARVLRAVLRARECRCSVEELLDVSDRRTLKALMARSGVSPARDPSIAEFLEAQQFVTRTNAAFNVLRTLLIS